MYTITEFPPGTTTFFSTALNELGNEVYTGNYIVIPPSTTANPKPNTISIKPTYATAPSPTTVIPPPVAPPGSRVLAVTVKEGMRFVAGDYKLYSTGPVRPGRAEGWVNSAAAIGADGMVASNEASNGNDLVLSGFQFNIPEGAVITGIKVTVKRNKL